MDKEITQPLNKMHTGKQAILPATPAAGIGAHFVSLPAPFGIGDIGDAAHAFVDTLAEMQVGVWQFLPTGPTAY
ncbi:MAG: 4-alpha-glucanotransferase, partial [Lysobacterales bacterium]